jgi:hypothetical protein
VTTIDVGAFSDCSGLTELSIPSSFSGLGDGDVFGGVTKIERVTVLGSPLSQSVVAGLEGSLTPGAKVLGAALEGEAFGRFTIAAG